jgi:hypothetical protein
MDITVQYSYLPGDACGADVPTIHRIDDAQRGNYIPRYSYIHTKGYRPGAFLVYRVVTPPRKQKQWLEIELGAVGPVFYDHELNPVRLRINQKMRERGRGHG